MTMRNSRMITFALSVLITAGGVTAAGATAAAAAHPAGADATVNSPGLPLNVRTGPARWYPRVSRLAHGTRIEPVCQVEGQYNEGTERDTAMWDRLPGGTYVHDGHVKRSRPVPRCGGTAAAPAVKWTHPLPGFPVQGGFRTPLRPAHRGVDLMSFPGTPVRAAAEGTVVEVVCNIESGGSCDVSGTPSSRGCGWYVKIAHPGRVATIYCHLLRRPDLQAGQWVSGGQIIGLIGSSGRSSYPHLHFEVHVNAPPTNDLTAVDPLWFMASVGAPMPRAR
jgi:murein DD-endopeptidase MepM/ murein hydrolase activator NlpD